MLKIGLTGGIGCGKTTVARLFAELGGPVIDADQIAHQLVAKGQPALAQIAQQFGADILDPDGSLNRTRLREIVFSNPSQKQKLESILHPLVYQSIQAELERLSTPYCIIAIPLLFETNMAHFVDRVLVVDCPVEIQIARVRKRDQLTLERIQSIIDSQVSRDFRKSHADDLIDNSESDYGLAEQVKKLHNLYLSLSAS
ncbi:dephospho-CoA kinase [Methylobacter sp. YRD-M1]|uniref:dephospho-CoA kinase n=1 Tax=Methylobacter sp. YRD-M1 TaxID=2911520 RepID=UPI00227D3691|nr:dephospho-CoA kinase [Methylobacter sp. YRD-M1]WAK02830.1 dephospho-CoA kinase [Methylobacter sp. YRD-M1]